MAYKRSVDSYSGAYLFQNNIWKNISAISPGGWGSSFDIQPMFCNIIDNSIQPMAPIASVSVYPNPSTGVFQIHSERNEIIGVTVYDLLGKIVKMSQKMDKNYYLVNLNNYPKGIYIIKVYTNSGIHEKKLIKI
jgi:hypothetical protein